MAAQAPDTPHDLHLSPPESSPSNGDSGDGDGWQTVESGSDWDLEMMQQIGIDIAQKDQNTGGLDVLTPIRPESLYNLAQSFTGQYLRLGNVADLEIALQKNQEALALIPADHPHRAYILEALAESFMFRYQRFGDLVDLETAVQKFEEVVALTPSGHPDRPRHLQALAGSLTDQYRRFGHLKDLEAALQKFEEVVSLTPADHPERPRYLHALAVSFTHRYQQLGDMSDLEAAVQTDQEAVALTPADHPNRANMLQSLAASLTSRYQRLGDLNDLEAALQIDHKAVALTPADHPDRANMLRSLALSFTDQYRRMGDLNDLEAAIQREQEALSLIPADHPDRPKYLQGLAASFMDRYQRLGDMNDLEAAVQTNQEAVTLTQADHPDRANMLQSLAASLISRYRHLGDRNDLEAALQTDQEAVALTPANHPERTHRLRSLAGAFTDRYRRMGDLNDLEAALQKDQEAVALSQVDHPDRPRYLQGLAVSLKDRYQKMGDLKDLEAALQSDQEAVALTPLDHPKRASRLQSLAASFCYKYQRFKHLEDLEAVNDAYHESFKIQTPSDPGSSWIAALGWASFSAQFQPAYCVTAYSAAFNLLPEILWLGHTIPVRQKAIQWYEIGNTTSAAAKACLKISDPKSAVQFIEQGLATIFQQMLQLKTDVDILPSNQAMKFQELSLALYNGTAVDPGKVARQRRDLLHIIRKEPGYEYFLISKPYSVLCNASQGGPVVILNSDADGCDGIIILNPTSDPVHVPLPNITLALLESQKLALKQVLGRCNVRTRDQSESTRLFGCQEGFMSFSTDECFKDLLAWLWNNVVDPIYQILALHGIHRGRLWWLPTGSFTGLPLHASPPTDQFIHSYTATLGSLMVAQAKKPIGVLHKVGVVGVTHTGHGQTRYLPAVKQEVAKISSIIKSPNLECLVGEQASPDAVKHQLQNCSWVHLACHGTQDLMEPTKSSLLLYGGVLELDTILKMTLSNAQFAFLAACQTAMGDTELVNESFHLGGGFIAAGFRGAVGTLWSMNDHDGPPIAESFYSHLFRNGRQPEAGDAAEALQLAVKKLKHGKIPYERWVPFIHMGL
ncbi:CHAT domain-containing protein [Mycena galopus ATCC 62051]|nr:CHAT domain-containing protein [Mycena galopus ATCC 62051]